MKPLFDPEMVKTVIDEAVEKMVEHRRRFKLGDRSCGGPPKCGRCVNIMRIEAQLQRENGESS